MKACARCTPDTDRRSTNPFDPEEAYGEMFEPDDAPSPFGPIANPADRFAHLPEPTRKWLEQLREDDISEITEAVQLVRSIRAWGKITKWLIWTAVATFLGVVGFGEGILKVLGWFAHGGRQ